MSYKSLFTALWSIAESLGYNPTLESDLHQTLLSKGFPMASFAWAEAGSMEGEKERRVQYDVTIKLMSDNVVGAKSRCEAMASLMDSAGSFVALLGEASSVAAVELLELKPEERMLTIAGECAVSLSLRMECVECMN